MVINSSFILTLRFVLALIAQAISFRACLDGIQNPNFYAQETISA